ncbi:MAG: PEP-CTERM sorting domain-containing protein [Akkermansiaceae bacterium]|nr:PEP-CTERM sorting domain-containing protein [Akkermansiaceae bacterium]
MKRVTSPLLAAAFVLLHPQISSAQSSIETSAYVVATNSGYGERYDPLYYSTIGTGNYSPGGAPVSAYGSATFNGIDRNGDDATMTFTGSSSASSGYGRMHTYASGSVQGSYFNPENPEYYNSPSGFVNEEGTPDQIIAYGQAAYSDTFTYTNTSAALTVNFLYQVSGAFLGDAGYHSVYVEFNGQSDYILLRADDGNFINRTWATQPFNILLNEPNAHRATTLSQFDFRPEYHQDGQDYSGTVDFSNTVTLVGMELRDGNGNLVTGWSLNAASGTTYPIPEPSALVLSALGTLALAGRRRR